MKRLLVALLIAAPAPVLGQAPKELATFHHGWFAYVQGGKPDSIALSQGQLIEAPPPLGKPGERQWVLSFGCTGKACLDFTIDQNAGAAPQVTWLKLNTGPAGDSSLGGFDATCDIKVEKLDATSVVGSGTCKWNPSPMNPLVSSFRLSVSS